MGNSTRVAEPVRFEVGTREREVGTREFFLKRVKVCSCNLPINIV